MKYIIIGLVVLLTLVAAGDPVNYQIQDQRVLYSCALGYYWTDQVCQPCKPLTNAYCTCDSANSCITKQCFSGYQNMGDEDELDCQEIPIGCESIILNQKQTSYVCSSCKTNYLMIQGICISNDNCKTFDSTTGKCQQCQDGYYFNWQFNYEFCSGIDDYYLQFKTQCTLCNTILNCQTCAGNYDCLACLPGYSWSYGDGCVKNSSCNTNISGCDTCSDSNTCVSCGDTTNKQLFENQCITCSSNCLKCDSTTTCSECEPEYFLNSGKCYKEIHGCTQTTLDDNSKISCPACQDKYYRLPDPNDNTVFTCKACTSENSSWVRCYGPNDKVEGYEGTAVIPTQCKDTFFLFQNACVEIKAFTNCFSIKDSDANCASCPSGGYYLIDNACKKCTGSCQECKDVSGKEQCVQCNPKYYLNSQDFSCYSCPTNCSDCQVKDLCLQCDEGYYANQVDYSCDQCKQENCSNCDEQFCYQCKTGYGMIINGNEVTCLECIANCLQCSEIGKCEICADNYQNIEGSCVDLKQANCQINNNYGCVVCNYGFILQNGHCYQCINPLGNGICDQNQAESINDVQIQEPYQPQTFQPSSYNSPYQTNHAIQQSRKTFVCNDGFYWTDQSCMPCKQIKNGYCTCTFYDGCDKVTCLNNNFQIGQDDINGCSGQCPNECQGCQLNDNKNAVICSGCIDGFSLIGGQCIKKNNCSTFDAQTGICQKCSDGYYLNYNLQQSSQSINNFQFCDKCNLSNCQISNSSTTCAQCKSGYEWSINEGVGQCQKISCIENCEKCSNSESCEECGQQYFLDKSVDPNVCTNCNKIDNCVYCIDQNLCSTCESGYSLTVQQTCIKCPLDPNCIECSDEQTCAKCTQGYFSNNDSKCYSVLEGCENNTLVDGKVSCTACKDTYTKQTNGQDLFKCTLCASIDLNWVRCSGPNDDPKSDTLIPTQCNDYLYLVNNQCVSYSASQNECVTWADNDQTNCTSCIPPLQYYETNECGKCDSDCISCKDDGSNGLDCTECKIGKYLQQDNGSCYPCIAGCGKCTKEDDCSECLGGYYQDQDGKCQKCSVDNCQSCPNDVCQQCMEQYYLTQDADNKTICNNCPTNCLTCKSDGISCLQCVDTLQLLKGQCVDQEKTNCVYYNEDRSCKVCEYGYYMTENGYCLQCLNPLSGVRQ